MTSTELSLSFVASRDLSHQSAAPEVLFSDTAVAKAQANGMLNAPASEQAHPNDKWAVEFANTCVQPHCGRHTPLGPSKARLPSRRRLSLFLDFKASGRSCTIDGSATGGKLVLGLEIEH